MKKQLIFMIVVLALTGCTRESARQGDSLPEQKQESQTPAMYDPHSLAEQVDSYVGQTGAAMQGSSLPADSTNADTPVTEPSGTTVPVVTGDGTFEPKDDAVYATTNVVVRNNPSTDADPVMNLKQGERVHRVGYSEAWTKVEMNGYFYYIASMYLSETP